MMRRFCNEEERSAEARKNLAPAFELAEGLFNFWLTAEKQKGLLQSTLNPAGMSLLMMLDVQALRLLRSVVENCRRCEGFSASILSRSLFETVLGVGFLVAKSVRIIVDPPPGTPGAVKFNAKPSLKRAKPGAKDELSQELRTHLLYAHAVFQQQERGPKILAQFVGSEKRAKRLTESADKQLIGELEKKIGPAWSYILRQTHRYSGLSVEHLAKVLDESLWNWYQTVYRFQSWAVHGHDLLKHMHVPDAKTIRPLFVSSDLQVYESLQTAITMFLVHMKMLQDNVGFGPEVDIAYDSFERKMDRLKWTKNGLAS